MKTIRFLCLLALLTRLASAQQAPSAAGPAEKASIGVLEFLCSAGSNAPMGRMLADEVGSLLEKTGRFVVLERMRIYSLMSEQKLDPKKILDAIEAGGANPLRGCDYLVLGSISSLQDEYTGSRQSAEIAMAGKFRVVRPDGVVAYSSDFSARVFGNAVEPAGRSPRPLWERQERMVAETCERAALQVAWDLSTWTTPPAILAVDENGLAQLNYGAPFLKEGDTLSVSQDTAGGTARVVACLRVAQAPVGRSLCRIKADDFAAAMTVLQSPSRATLRVSRGADCFGETVQPRAGGPAWQGKWYSRRGKRN